MYRVLISGGIGSGKSTVCRIFEEKGVPVYYSDDRAKALMDKEEVRVKIQNAFGWDVYKYNYPGLQWLGFSKMTLDRKALAKIVFSNKRKLETLNSIVHPCVAEDFDLWCKYQKHPYVIEEAAVAIENNSGPKFDLIIVVDTNEETRIKRTIARDNCTEEQVRKRMNNQMSDKDRIKFADYVVYNNEDSNLESQVDAINIKILKHLKIKNV